MEANSLMFENTSLTRLFFKCAVPAALSMLFSGVYSIADGIFVGRFIGEDALAAVNLTMPLIMISFALADMIAVGSSVQIAMFLGQKDNDAACRTFSMCIKIIVGLSIIVGLFFFIFAEPLLILMGTEGTALQYGVEYIHVYAVFAPIIIVFFAVDNYLRICGRQNFSMALNIFAALLNILLDFLWIVVFDQGIWAAAFASCVSISAGTVLAMWPFFRKKLDLRFVKGSIPVRQFVRLLANGSSEFFSSISGSIFAFVLNIVLLSLGGATAVAAVSVVLYAESIISMVIFGMCDSMQPAISYCYGAGLKKRVYDIEKRVILAAAVLSMLACLFLRYGGDRIVPFFVEPGNTELMKLSIHMMSIYALSYLVNWVDGCLSMYLTALGKAARSFIVSVMGTLVLPLLSLAVLVPPFELDGVCWMPLLAGGLNGLLALILVFTIKK